MKQFYNLAYFLNILHMIITKNYDNIIRQFDYICIIKLKTNETKIYNSNINYYGIIFTVLMWKHEK